MGTKLVTRSEFARLAKVSPTTITEICRTLLAAACEGKFINPEHPDAIAYLQKRDPLRTANKPNVLPGVDALYQDCVDHANSIGRLSTNSLQTKFGIGYDRAKKIKGLIEAADAFHPEEPIPVVTMTMVEQAATMLAATKPQGIGGDRLRAAVAQHELTAPNEEYQLPGTDEFPNEEVEDIGDLTLKEVCNKYGTAERFKVWLQARKLLVDIGAKEIANAEKRRLLIPRAFVEAHLISHYDRAHINLMTDAAKTIARRVISDTQAGASIEDCEQLVSAQISRHIQEAKASIERALSSV